MEKIKIKGCTIQKHDNHLDIDIPVDSFPFEDIRFGEILFCANKGFQKLGLRTDDKIHLFISNLKYKKEIEQEIINQKVSEIEKKLSYELQKDKTILGLQKENGNLNKIIAKLKKEIKEYKHSKE